MREELMGPTKVWKGPHPQVLRYLKVKQDDGEEGSRCTSGASIAGCPVCSRNSLVGEAGPVEDRGEARRRQRKALASHEVCCSIKKDNLWRGWWNLTFSVRGVGMLPPNCLSVLG